MSNVDVISLDVCAPLIFAGQLIIVGARTPPSNCVPLPALYGLAVPYFVLLPFLCCQEMVIFLGIFSIIYLKFDPAASLVTESAYAMIYKF